MDTRLHIAVAAPLLAAIACTALAAAPQPRDRTLRVQFADTAERATPADAGPPAIAADTGPEGSSCYPDCNGDGMLTVMDFGCFQTKFVGADPYADCNGDSALTVADFGCFQTKFVVGCP